MTCWAALHVAADLLQTSIQDVLARAAAGELLTKEEHGLLFVDVGNADLPPDPAFRTYNPDTIPLDFRAARANVHRLRPAA